MPQLVRFERGDVVEHPRRPEWGEGVVEKATSIEYQGKPGQRLAVTFANRGKVAINTAVAPLVHRQVKDAGNRISMKTTPMEVRTKGQGWLASLSERNGEHELHPLPEQVSDPFTSLRQRLEATAELYRFSTEARSLIDWAVAQTGLGDPLTKYTRQDLEQAFARFARSREQHLFKLTAQLKSQAKADVVRDVATQTPHRSAREALHRALRA